MERLQKEAETSPTDRVIVEWDTSCLKELPSKVAETMADEYDGTVNVFDDYELDDSSVRTVLKRGVYLRDRLGTKDKTDPEVRQILKGREYALGIIARALELHTWRPGGGSACEGACRKALQSAMLAKDVSTLEATHYSRLGVDVLHVKNLRKHKEVRAGLSPSHPASRLGSRHLHTSVSARLSPGVLRRAASSHEESEAAGPTCCTSHPANREVNEGDCPVWGSVSF